MIMDWDAHYEPEAPTDYVELAEKWLKRNLADAAQDGKLYETCGLIEGLLEYINENI